MIGAYEMRSKCAELNGSSILGVCGLIVLAGGLYFLIFDPISAGTDYVDVHKVAIGQTLTIAGTVLAAVQWRPR